MFALNWQTLNGAVELACKLGFVALYALLLPFVSLSMSELLVGLTTVGVVHVLWSVGLSYAFSRRPGVWEDLIE